MNNALNFKVVIYHKDIDRATCNKDLANLLSLEHKNISIPV